VSVPPPDEPVAPDAEDAPTGDDRASRPARPARPARPWDPPVTARMRVLHVSAPTTEGCAVVALASIRAQLARGWNVTVACPSDGWLGHEARALGAQVRWWSARREPTRGVPGELTALAAVVRDVDPDLVHLHSSKAGLVGRLLLRGRRTTVFQPHGWSFLAATGTTGRLALAWERRAMRWTDQLVCVSEEEHQVAADRGVRGPTLMLPNGVDLQRWPLRDREDRLRARAELGLDPSPLAVCVGRLTEQKGQRDLLTVWPQVRDRVPQARLALIGDGPDRADLDRVASQLPGVSLLGNRSDVATWLSAADVVAVPSHWEGMALVPLEAMASGRSVVAARVTGVAESVPEGAGAVVPVGPGPALVDALADRLADPAGTADPEGLVGHQHVVAHHDATTSAEALAASYLRLLVGRRVD